MHLKYKYMSMLVDQYSLDKKKVEYWVCWSKSTYSINIDRATKKESLTNDLQLVDRFGEYQRRHKNQTDMRRGSLQVVERKVKQDQDQHNDCVAGRHLP